MVEEGLRLLELSDLSTGAIIVLYFLGLLFVVGVSANDLSWTDSSFCLFLLLF